MNKTDKIAFVAKFAAVSEAVAKAYLEAEEWCTYDAVLDIRAERAAGIFDEAGA